MTNALEEMDLTAAQGPILGFLSHQAEPPCPRDVEEEFRLSHPTVSGILSRLEQKGFVELRPDGEDRRKKRIWILPKGNQCTDRIHALIRENEQRIVSDFTPQEREQFASLLQRAIVNMGGSPCRRNHKEENPK